MSLVAFRSVREHVARNPVAQAIEQQRMVKAVGDFLIGIHMLEDGKPAQGDIQCAARVIAVAMRCCQLDRDIDEAAERVMRGSLSALTHMAQRDFRWRSADAQSIDIGMQYALEVYRLAKSKTRTQAWRDVQRMEDEA